MFENLVIRNENEINEILNTDASAFFTLIDSVIAIIRNFDVSINDSILEQLLLYVKIMTIRLLNNKTIENDNLHVEKSSFEYILSEKIVLQIENYSNSIVNKNDVNWIYRFVIGKCLKKTESNLQIDHEIVEKILPKSIAMIADKYGYDFAHDIDLYTSMSIHLNALTKRAGIDNYLINPMLDEIKTYSLLAYDMATDVSMLINEVLNVMLPDDEISYFAIYLHLAIERQKQQIIPRKALVVDPSGKGMSEMIAHFIKKQFGEYVSKLKTCSYYDLDQIDYSQYDYIFTMKPLNINVPLPVIIFSLNSDKYNIEKTRMQILGGGNKEFILASLTPATLFFNDIDAYSKDDALRKLVNRIGEVVNLKPNFLESVIKRENIVSTELDNGFAIPHPIDKDVADRSFFSVSVLKNPIIWRKKKIRIVLLTYIKGDMEKLEQFYDIFAQLVANKEYEISLIDKPTYENFVDIVKEISE